MQHYPVMLRECLEYLNIRPDGIYCDATCGLGGHSGAIAARLSTGVLIACDRDAESLELARANTAGLGERIRFHQALFSQLAEALAAEGISQVDGLLADLGVSRYQLTAGERGFSLMADGPLDMRMSRGQQRTAAEIVNFESEHELARLIYTLGEERRSRKIARAIVRGRPITTTGQLAKLIEGVAPRAGKLHPATQTFMALRMAVNDEMEELDALLECIPKLLRSGGRAVIVTFMSLEDRKVKQSFQAMAKAGRAHLLTRHVVRPAEEETRDNPPSRSAKLRAIEVL
ncbi:MAG: 16S rRNA (cytosine(1402)-N(4))-methyltransferase RsmH [Bryobacterales bacterium]|nr:16S rRNA (cytosine(1402)-N(4))-methyltransferase RsmH [Bryobacterales bacterium]MBV9399097.1 16S rRNA (cytosine(1402)-N(4))-methyltransferase RsmH [Bryobacterales bacterium]